MEVCCVPVSTSMTSVPSETIAAKDMSISAVENKEKISEVITPKTMVQEPVKTETKAVEKLAPQQATANFPLSTNKY